MAKYSTNTGSEKSQGHKWNSAAQTDAVSEPQPDEINAQSLEYVVEDEVHASEAHLDDVEGYFIQGVDRALEAIGESRAAKFTDIGLEKLAEEELTPEKVEEVKNFSQNAIAEASDKMDQAYTEIQEEYGEDPLVFAAIQGSLAQGTCVPPYSRHPIDEVGPVDVDLFVMGETYDGDERWTSRNMTLKETRRDANTREIIETLEKDDDVYYDNVKSSSPHGRRATQSFPPYKLPIHPIGVTKGDVVEDGKFETMVNNMEDNMLNPRDLDEENQTRKDVGDFIVNMWEGVFIPEQYADPEIVEEIDRLMNEYTTEDGRLIESELRPAVKDSTIGYIEDKYGEEVIV